MLAPQPGGFAPGPGTHSFSVPQLSVNYPSTPNRPPAPVPSGSKPRTAFRAPAHKHAHHLHSIPPREKSTRTLIIDHMLWVHGRTRFAQARAELGMTDRTGGPSSPNYVHRRRPENYDEEADENSEGEDVVKLKARAGDPHHPPGDEEDDRLNSQDLTLARSLRLRAEGLEKVVTSMLSQPPTFHPMDDEDVWTPPTSPQINTTDNTNRDPHKLPNGVRLRLALGTIINDLFARQAPPPPFRHTIHVKSPSSDQSSSGSPSLASPTELPPALSSLSMVCAALHMPASYSTASASSANFYNTQPVRTRQWPSPSSRTRSLYNAGADPSTANSPPSLRCPRHLHTGCEICVEAKTAARQTGGRGRASSFNDYRSGQTNVWKALPGGVGPGGGGITGWQDGSGIGSGLLRPGVKGSCLRRNVSGLDDVGSSTGSGNTKLSELIPRFIRLSALVAVELAMEAKEEQEDTSSARSKEAGGEQFAAGDRDLGQTQHQLRESGDFSPLPSPMSSATVRAVAQAQDGVYDIALRPTREWYLLLAGLLTRAALEGYLTAGWRGSQAVECLLTVGLGMAESEQSEKVEIGFEEFDPDGLPSLLEATKLLFPSSQSGPSQKKGKAEEEYEAEMCDRIRRFYDIPASTPDLSTHMEDLAWQYPAEPVERAAVRFCEAIAKWRGKPELETYKKTVPTPTYDYTQDITEASSLSLDSLVHSNPPTPVLAHNNTQATRPPRRPRRKPSIDVYFTQPSSSRGDTWKSNTNKRMRSPDDTRTTPSKRLNIG
ncbi:hypothetical protein LshimejAT787_0804110 [Lyophyllum shimeji]|uniref:Uncharacterized protein n=1 Tax=Lyophyllum shimeji TaxID=47721 RepID=A0A9P3UQT9_LYOSH|nr:hypothetical protein LshimejAT787_0804110 [Lyophyllum shimeji]